MEFRELIEALDGRGDLLRVRNEVDPEYELAALLAQAEARGRACWFERVAGSDFPVVGGVMTSPARHALSIGRAEDEIAPVHRFGRLLQSCRENPMPARIVESGPVADVVLTGDQVDLGKLPIARFFGGDSHRFITAGLGIAMDPESGLQNVGYYRAPIIDRTRFSLGTAGKSNLGRIYKASADNNVSLPVAFVIGAPPSLLLAAGAQMPPESSDMDVAGALQGGPLALMKCQTSDLLVPVGAEFVIEAIVDFSEEVTHRMGEYGDLYGDTTSPVATVTAITHRHSPVFYTIMGGMNREHNALGVIIFSELRDELLGQLRTACPFVTDISIDFAPRRGSARAQLAVAIDKRDEGQPRAVIDELFGLMAGPFPLRAIMQRIVVVDSDVDVRNLDDVEWAISSRMDGAAKITVFEDKTPDGYPLGRLGIDATVSAGFEAAHERPAILSREKYRLDDYL